MSTFPASAALHVSPSPRKSTPDSVGPAVGLSERVTPDLGLMEITEGQYTHRVQDADPHRPDYAGSPEMCLDLSAVNDQHCLMSGLYGDKTPAGHGDYMLSINRSESHQSARVCLEKRLNSVCGGSPVLQDQSAVPINFLTVHQQPAEPQEPLVYLQMEKWMKNYGGHPAELSTPHGAGVSTPTTSMCGQVFGHIPPMLDHQGLMHPFTYLLEMDNLNAQFISSSGPTEEHQQVIAKDNVTKPAASRVHRQIHGSQTTKAVPETRRNNRTAQSSVRSTRSKEEHNRAERKRRKRIRLSCDKLNMLVPFCHQKMDKATTLQWTADFLTYINNTYGNALKEEFKKAFQAKKA